MSIGDQAFSALKSWQRMAPLTVQKFVFRVQLERATTQLARSAKAARSKEQLVRKPVSYGGSDGASNAF